MKVELKTTEVQHILIIYEVDVPDYVDETDADEVYSYVQDQQIDPVHQSCFECMEQVESVDVVEVIENDN